MNKFIIITLSLHILFIYNNNQAKNGSSKLLFLCLLWLWCNFLRQNLKNLDSE